MGTAIVKAAPVQPAGELVPHEPPARFAAEALIAKAIDKGLSLETLEKLLAMRAELKAEQAREDFFAALSAFQGECPVIVKDRAVLQNGRERYRYASLGDIVKVVGPLLPKHGLSYRLVTRLEPETGYMVATCTVHHAAGHSEASEFKVPLAKDNFMNAAQHHGSARTYACRYAFCDAFGIMTGDEDDDAGSLDTPKPQAQPPQAARPPAQPQPAGKPPPAPQQKPGVQPPANGLELRQRLGDYDARLASEKKITKGELLAHVSRAGTDQGWSDDLATWDSPDQIDFAIEETRRFVAARQKPANGRAAAVADPENGIQLHNRVRELSIRLHADGLAQNEEDLLEHIDGLLKTADYPARVNDLTRDQVAEIWALAKQWEAERRQPAGAAA
jgi:hypothetical protein